MIKFSVYCDKCGNEISTSYKSKALAVKDAKERDGFVTLDKEHLCLICAEKAGRLVKCPGEAHSNPHIDHCMVCAPRWGLVVA